MPRKRDLATIPPSASNRYSSKQASLSDEAVESCSRAARVAERVARHKEKTPNLSGSLFWKLGCELGDGNISQGGVRAQSNGSRSRCQNTDRVDVIGFAHDSCRRKRNVFEVGREIAHDWQRTGPLLVLQRPLVLGTLSDAQVAYN